jgi:hypothetical protein
MTYFDDLINSFYLHFGHLKAREYLVRMLYADTCHFDGGWRFGADVVITMECG